MSIGSTGDYMDIRFVRDGKRIIRFTIRGVARIGGDDHDFVRFDTAHGFAHRDLLDWNGNTIAKTELQHSTNFARAMTDAIVDLKSQWKQLRSEFQRRKP
jgi:hypothetical protein